MRHLLDIGDLRCKPKAGPRLFSFSAGPVSPSRDPRLVLGSEGAKLLQAGRPGW